MPKKKKEKEERNEGAGGLRAEFIVAILCAGVVRLNFTAAAAAAAGTNPPGGKQVSCRRRSAQLGHVLAHLFSDTFTHQHF